MSACIDHLVVVASHLEQGVQWCQARLGITPGPGGKHPIMGTHNRLFNISSTGFQKAYFEIIAIDPDAAPPQRRRWFDLDNPRLQERVVQEGPQLAHFVVRVPQLASSLHQLHGLGLAPGEALAASRQTPEGPLQWRISVREDGQRLFDGVMPTLIEWGPRHPVLAMAPSGVRLRSLSVQHPQAGEVQAAFGAIGLASVAVHSGPARIRAQLETPLGPVVLE